MDEVEKFGPDWYHGGGSRAQQLAEIPRNWQFAIMQKAKELGVNPKLLFYSLKYADNTFNKDHSLGHIAESLQNAPAILNEYQSAVAEHPDIQRKIENYDKEPGALKYIADLTRGWLGERAQRKYQPYEKERIARPTLLQQTAKDMAINVANPQEHAQHSSRMLSTLENMRDQNRTLMAASPYMQQGIAPIQDQDRNQFLDSVRTNILDPQRHRMTRHLLEEVMPKLMSDRAATGTLHGGKTMEMRNKLLKDFYENLDENEKKYQYQALLQGQTTAEKARERAINAAQVAGQTAGKGQEEQLRAASLENEAMGTAQMRGLMGAEALNKIGTQEQALAQQDRDIEYKNFLQQQEGIMPEIERANAVYRGLNPPQTIASFHAEAPRASSESLLGQMGMNFALANMMKKNQKAGGRVTLAGGGIASDVVRNKILQAMMQDDGQSSSQDLELTPDMLQQAPESAPPSSALDHMNQMRGRLDNQAASYEGGNQEIDPMMAGMANMFGAAGASKSNRVLERLAEGSAQVVPGYMAAIQENRKNKELSANIKKALLDTYQKEHEHALTLKNQRDIAQMKIDAKNSSNASGTAARSKVLRDPNSGAFYHVTPEKAEIIPGSPNAGESSMPVTVETSEGPEIRNVDLESDKEKRTKEKDQTNASIKFYTQGLRHIDKMDKYLKNVGISGIGYDLNDRLATGQISEDGKGLWGNAKDRGAYKKETSDLVNLAARFQGREGSRSATALKFLQEAKPNVKDRTSGANEEIHKNLRESFMIGLEEEKFRQKLINKKVKDYVATEALQKWQESDPFVFENGRLVGFKYKPEEFLPEEYKVLTNTTGTKPKQDLVISENDSMGSEPTIEEKIEEARRRGLIA